MADNETRTITWISILAGIIVSIGIGLATGSFRIVLGGIALFLSIPIVADALHNIGLIRSPTSTFFESEDQKEAVLQVLVFPVVGLWISVILSSIFGIGKGEPLIDILPKSEKKVSTNNNRRGMQARPETTSPVAPPTEGQAQAQTAVPAAPPAPVTQSDIPVQAAAAGRRRRGTRRSPGRPRAKRSSQARLMAARRRKREAAADAAAAQAERDAAEAEVTAAEATVGAAQAEEEARELLAETAEGETSEAQPGRLRRMVEEATDIPAPSVRDPAQVQFESELEAQAKGFLTSPITSFIITVILSGLNILFVNNWYTALDGIQAELEKERAKDEIDVEKIRRLNQEASDIIRNPLGINLGLAIITALISLGTSILFLRTDARKFSRGIISQGLSLSHRITMGVLFLVAAGIVTGITFIIQPETDEEGNPVPILPGLPGIINTVNLVRLVTIAGAGFWTLSILWNNAPWVIQWGLLLLNGIVVLISTIIAVVLKIRENQEVDIINQRLVNATPEQQNTEITNVLIGTRAENREIAVPLVARAMTGVIIIGVIFALFVTPAVKKVSVDPKKAEDIMKQIRTKIKRDVGDKRIRTELDTKIKKITDAIARAEALAALKPRIENAVRLQNQIAPIVSQLNALGISTKELGFEVAPVSLGGDDIAALSQ